MRKAYSTNEAPSRAKFSKVKRSRCSSNTFKCISTSTTFQSIISELFQVKVAYSSTHRIPRHRSKPRINKWRPNCGNINKRHRCNCSLICTLAPSVCLRSTRPQALLAMALKELAAQAASTNKDTVSTSSPNLQISHKLMLSRTNSNLSD